MRNTLLWRKDGQLFLIYDGTMARYPRFSSVQGRLGMLFLAFLLLLIISVIKTFNGLEGQNQDARTINLAGRQRMLLQQLAGLSRGYVREGTDWDISELTGAAAAFEQTLAVLRAGGQITDYTGETLALPAPEDASLRAELDALYAGWLEYSGKIDLLLLSTDLASREQHVQEIEGLLPGLVEQADRVVRAYENISSEKVARLRSQQILFLIGGLALLSAGWWITYDSIVQPLNRLERSAQRIGEGDFSSPVPASGPVEIQVLGRTLDAMRSQVLTSHEDLRRWAATLEDRVHQRTSELEALSVVSREINSNLSINEVLTSVTEKAQKLLGSEVASLCLLDRQGKVLSLHAAAGPEGAILQNHSPADGPVIGRVLTQSCAHPCGLQSCQGFCQIIDPAYRISHMAAPLHSGEKVIGALCVGSASTDAFRPEMVSVLTQLAGAASVALENSRLYRQAEQAATLEERQRIASEMHDGLLQTLSFLRWMVRLTCDDLDQGNLDKARETLGQIERAEEQAEKEIRRAIASLHDNSPIHYTLQEQLAMLASELSNTAPPVQFETDVVLPVVLSRQESEQVLRVVREAILNAQHYSRADQVALGLKKAESEIILTVRDEGIGFTPGMDPGDGRAHFGMKIMQARAARLGARLQVISAPGAGTVVQLRWTPGS